MDVITDKKLKIGIQGYEGSFHQIAAQAYYKQPLKIVPAGSFTALVNNTMNQDLCDQGVMAIENSIAGSILSNYNLLEEANLFIIGEVYIQISQHLMAMPGENLQSIKEVHSHPMAILQCRKYFRQYPEIKMIETEDTALSAKNISDQQLQGIGTIASDLAAELYGLQIIEEHVETVRNNYTRFLILSRSSNQAEWDTGNKASLHFNVSHQPGSLVKAMQVFAENDINISKIQSVPVIEHEWQYSFHIDIEFDTKTQYDSAMEQLAPLCKNLKVLGIYKNGKL